MLRLVIVVIHRRRNNQSNEHRAKLVGIWVSAINDVTLIEINVTDSMFRVWVAYSVTHMHTAHCKHIHKSITEWIFSSEYDCVIVSICWRFQYVELLKNLLSSHKHRYVIIKLYSNPNIRHLTWKIPFDILMV